MLPNLPHEQHFKFGLLALSTRTREGFESIQALVKTGKVAFQILALHFDIGQIGGVLE